MEKVLLTGVAGFIASKTAEILLNDGIKVVGIDNMNDYYDVRLKEYHLKKLYDYKDFEFIKLDIENYDALDELFKKNNFDAVINLAARAGVRYSIENPFVYESTNIAGTLNLLELMRKYNIKKKVLASTSSLYAGQKMPFLETLAVNEPISPYAATKKAAEALCYSYHHLFDIDVTILRYFTVYGPAGRPDMAPFRFIKWVSEEKAIQLFGDGTQTRDFTFVDDIAMGTVKGLKKLGFEIINLGNGKNPKSINAMINEIEKNIGKKAIIDYHDVHKADLKDTWADNKKAKEILDWEPQVDFEEGFKKSCLWYMENREWTKDINT